MNIKAITDRLVSPALASGLFDKVQSFEPKDAPGYGLSYAMQLDSIRPIPLASGLAVTSIRLQMTGRIYRPFLRSPEELADPAMADATMALMTAYSGDFELGDEVRNIDLLGAHGEPLTMKAGYQTIEKTVFRIADIIIPMIISDAFPQEG